MMHAFALLSRILLAVSLAAYGSFTPAGAGTGAGLFAMEICADGVVQTVLFDADGTPVAPADDCRDCARCCHLSLARLDPPRDAQRVRVLHDAPAHRAAPDTAIIRTCFSRPMPRGPPLRPASMLTAPALILTDQVVTGAATSHDTISGGRSFSEDAIA
ncbi:hypothetical protein [Roseivivax sp. CAU 1753]